MRRKEDPECPVTKFVFTCLLTFLPRACSVIWIEYVYRLDKVTLRALGSLQSSNLRLNYL